jgi:hypothetical protein
MWADCIAEPRAFCKPEPQFRPTKYELPEIEIQYTDMLERGEMLPATPIPANISVVDGGRLAKIASKLNLIRADITRSVGDHVISVIKIGVPA